MSKTVAWFWSVSVTNTLCNFCLKNNWQEILPITHHQLRAAIISFEDGGDLNLKSKVNPCSFIAHFSLRSSIMFFYSKLHLFPEKWNGHWWLGLILFTMIFSQSHNEVIILILKPNSVCFRNKLSPNSASSEACEGFHPGKTESPEFSGLNCCPYLFMICFDNVFFYSCLQICWISSITGSGVFNLNPRNPVNLFAYCPLFSQ